MSGTEQKVFLLVFTRYTATSLANEQVVGALESTHCPEPGFHAPAEEDVFPEWADSAHTVDCGSGRRTRTNNLLELNNLLAAGWVIRRMAPMHEGCACLIELSRERDGEEKHKETMK